MAIDWRSSFEHLRDHSVWRLLATRAVRGFADGFVTVLLADYLSRLGFSGFQVGALVTSTLVGSAALTFLTGWFGHAWDRQRVLLAASALMLVTGVGFAALSSYWPLFLVAFAGTLNPSAGDVSVFLPIEQAALSDSVPARARTEVFAWYNLSGSFLGAAGALVSALPVWLSRRQGWDLLLAERGAFVLYAGCALLCAWIYRRMPGRKVEHPTPRRALEKSRGRVLRLSALFSLDSLGGGFVLQSLLVLWLHRRFDLSLETTGSIFFFANLFAGLSQLASSRLAARIGLLETMVYTHLPANGLLILAGLMPTPATAVGCLLLRMCVSNMDVPARQSYVMSVVPPEERAAASSVTNVPRSLASAITPVLAGWMLDRSVIGWPLVCGGVLKAIYDLLLYWQFRHVRAEQESAAPRSARAKSRARRS